MDSRNDEQERIRQLTEENRQLADQLQQQAARIQELEAELQRLQKLLAGKADSKTAKKPVFKVRVSQIQRRIASGPTGEIPPGESIVKRGWRPESSAEAQPIPFD